MSQNILALIQSAGPLYTQMETLGELVDAAIDSEHEYTHEHGETMDKARLCDRRSGYPTALLIEGWKAFETACDTALVTFISAEESGWSAETVADTAREILADDGPLYIYHSLCGAGVGIWDHEVWFRDFSEDPSEVANRCHEKLTAMAALTKFADCTGGGSLAEALTAAAYRDED